jgi:hypothetical protein
MRQAMYFEPIYLLTPDWQLLFGNILYFMVLAKERGERFKRKLTWSSAKEEKV